MYAYIAFVFLSIGEGKLSDLPTHAGFSPRPCAESQMFAASFSFIAKNARIAALWERRGEEGDLFEVFAEPVFVLTLSGGVLHCLSGFGGRGVAFGRASDLQSRFCMARVSNSEAFPFQHREFEDSAHVRPRQFGSHSSSILL